MAVGLPISMVPIHKYQEGSRRAAWIFETDAAAAHNLAARNHVEYLLVGTPERTAHPHVDERFDHAPEFFEPVFRNREATVYRVR